MNHSTRTPLARACVVALGCALGAAGSQAATANASLSNFQIIATDLDLNDGIEAGSSFPDSNSTILQVLSGIPGAVWHRSRYHYRVPSIASTRATAFAGNEAHRVQALTVGTSSRRVV
jgi:hypothetical protein